MPLFDVSDFDSAQLPREMRIGQSEFTWFIIEGSGRTSAGTRHLAILFCLHRTGPRLERPSRARAQLSSGEPRGLSALLAPLAIATDDRPLLMAAVYDLDNPEQPPRVVERTVEHADFDAASFSGVSTCGSIRFSQFSAQTGAPEIPAAVRSFFAGGGFGAALRLKLDDIDIELFLRPAKPHVTYGPGGSPEIRHRDVVTSYVQRTRLDVVGQLRLSQGGRPETIESFVGQATQDHQWFKVTNPLLKWIWPHLRLDDGRELMGYVLRDSSAGRWASADDGREIGRGGWLVEHDGRVVTLPTLDVRSVPEYDVRTSRGLVPTRFRVEVPEMGLALTLEHCVKTPYLPMRAFGSWLDAGAWEGPARIVEATDGVQGEAWVEVVNAATARLGS